jgi:hypothetical protein
MAAGRATMATGWSGNLEFMTEQNSTLLPYVLKPVNDPSGIYQSMPDACWADVNVDTGAVALRELFDSPNRRLTLAANAQRDVSAALRSRTYSEALGIPV